MGRLALLVSLVAVSAVALSQTRRKAGLAPVQPSGSRAAPVAIDATPEPERPATPRLWQPLPAPAVAHAPAGLSGVVVDGRGQPVVGMLVIVEPPDQGWHAVARSDAGGGFRFDLAPGRYQLRTLNGISERLELDVGAGERLDGVELRWAPQPPSPVETGEGDVLDQRDRCPNQPNDDEDIDGCPEYTVYE
ncbi:MAG TPA: carboxypeptidase-like regulatory domain-containing protein [Polyangia bacterium]|nr:carboxypeptidase-like regulatory domain-containing protein [Polyangia bacterium]